MATEDFQTEQTFDTKMDDLMNKNINYTLWKNYLSLYREICCNNGIIFGGSTRDYVKRNIAAKKFSAFCKDNNFNFKESYMNSDIQNETFDDRKLLPTDIDVYIKEKDFKEFQKNIQKKYMHYQLDDYSPSYLFTNNETLKKFIDHYVYEIDFLGGHGKQIIKNLFGITLTEKFRIKIDYIVLKESAEHHNENKMDEYLYPPFGNPDFDVNQLYMKYTHLCGFSININNCLINSMINTTHFFNAFNSDEVIQDIKVKIFKNIENDIAVPILPNLHYFKMIYPTSKPRINLGRLQKMINKGYSINSLETLAYDKIYTKMPETYECNEIDKCVICLDTFTEIRPWYQIGCKCKVKLHLSCLSQYVRNPSMNEDRNMTCPHCRTVFRQCHCEMINFINSLKHKYAVFDNTTTCRDCDYCTDNSCTVWYKECICCAH